MRLTHIDLNDIALGPDGTVILTDDALSQLAAMPGACHTGGDGQVNVSNCTNTASCNNSSNGHCSNAWGHCENSTNNNDCMVIISPEG